MLLSAVTGVGEEVVTAGGDDVCVVSIASLDTDATASKRACCKRVAGDGRLWRTTGSKDSAGGKQLDKRVVVVGL